MVYNHAPFLRQCLDGFVMQKTTFKFEAIVHDDASTDGSSDIIREYAEKYPYIIIPILEEVNQYSKPGVSLGRIMNNACRGKYIAMCEGDDYWTDPLKLQKQVNFMENHPDCTMSFTNAMFHIENSDEEDSVFGNAANRYYSGEELFSHWIVPTASVLYRHSVLDSNLYQKVLTDKNLLYGDTPLVLTCAHFGDVYGMSDITCVYRKHDKGVTSLDSNSVERLFLLRNHYLEIPLLFGEKYNNKAKKSAVGVCFMSVIQGMKSCRKIDFEKFFTMFRISFKYSIIYIFKYLIEKIKGSPIR